MKAQATRQAKPATTTFAPARAGVLRRKCACGGTPGPTGECAACGRKKRLGVGGTPLQPKLRIGRVDDPLEREADRVAEQVMRMPEPDLQQKVDEGGESLQSKPLVQQRVTGPEAGLEEAPPIVHEVLQSPGRPLDPSMRQFMESRFGYDFGQVRVHVDGKAAVSVRAVNAQAFTVRRDVVFGAKQYSPGTIEGQRLLVHELTHVVQQSSISPVVLRRNRDQLRRDCNKAQNKAIDDAKSSAAIRTQVAYFRLKLPTPGPPDRDWTEVKQYRAYILARKIFGEDLNMRDMDRVKKIVEDMRDWLSVAILSIVCSGMEDRNCGNRPAYVIDKRPPIRLCPAFFSNTPEQRIRTLIHEAAHLAGIGKAFGESYCVIYDCENSCGGFDSADSWAHFVHCLSGQLPDQPPTIQGQPRGSAQEGSSGKRS